MKLYNRKRQWERIAMVEDLKERIILINEKHLLHINTADDVLDYYSS